MPNFNCKMCGGSIKYNAGDRVVTCEYCGSTQTISNITDDRKINLFNRANALRLKNEFDKALATYETILLEFSNDAEAYWGLCLCKYGIEYVNDPKTGNKIPTCHRTLFQSIFDDIDYKEAINNSDVISKEIYEAEAKNIDSIQKKIIETSQKEEPYDIFICYKETDDSGKRTKDSVLAQEVYSKLTANGYKVFFSRITLEKKIGIEYEPIIFAALRSSKVMLSIGSKPEYFNSPWVKNEWARFLSFMKDDSDKYLIPCYIDMDPYDMPEEFMMLQAQDMSKLGFMQDLLRGIDKLISREKNSLSSQNIEISNNHRYVNDSNGSYNLDSLLTRADILIQDIDYKNKDSNYLDAQGIVKEVLKLDPKNAKAYVCLTLIDLQLNEEKDLNNCREELLNNKNFKWAIKFASDDYKQVLESYLNKVNQNIENDRCEKIYQDALIYMNDKNYVSAIKKFETIINYKDSKTLIEDSVSTMFDENYYDATILLKDGYYDSVISLFDFLNHLSYCNDKTASCKELLLEAKYQKALSYKDEKRYKEAIHEFFEIIEYKESKEIKNSIESGLYLKATHFMEKKQYAKAINLFSEIDYYKDSSGQINICKDLLEKQHIRNKKIKTITIISLFLFISVMLFTSIDIIYKNANSKRFDYEVVDNVAYITGYNNSSQRVSIPAYISNGLNIRKYKVVGIKDYAFRGCTSLTSVTIPDSITSISNGAFYNCTSLTNITIPDSVTSIGEYAFYNCTSLSNITIPDSITSISNGVFYNCTSLTNITIPDSITSISYCAFYNCTSLTNITIPNSVTKIGDYAFRGCTSLTNITIPKSVTSIGDGAFDGCSLVKIYCEAESKPSGWSDYWNPYNRPVEWGYTK